MVANPFVNICRQIDDWLHNCRTHLSRIVSKLTIKELREEVSAVRRQGVSVMLNAKEGTE